MNGNGEHTAAGPLRVLTVEQDTSVLWHLVVLVMMWFGEHFPLIMHLDDISLFPLEASQIADR